MSRSDFKVSFNGKKFGVQGFDNGDVRFPYDLLVELERHLTVEHSLPERCYVLEKMRELHMIGCNVAVAANERKA